MSNVTPKTDLRMLITPLERALVGAPLPDGTTVSLVANEEAGPRVGGFVPVRDTPTTLVSSGTLDASIPDVTVSTVLAGGVGTATWGWTPDGGSAMYWDPPASVSGFELIDHALTSLRFQNGITGVRRPDTGLLLAVASDSISVALDCYIQDLRGKWSSSTVVADYAPHSCVIAVPNGSAWRYLCLYMQGSASAVGVRMSYSDDDGATWSVGSTRGMRGDTYTESELVRIRAAYLNGKILLLVYYRPGTGTDTIDQWVSTDGGGTFTRVETFSTDLRAYPDCYAYNGAIYVAYLKYESGRTGADIFPGVRILTDAAQPLSAAGAGLSDVVPEDAGWPMEWGTQTAGEFTAGECAIVVDDDGVVYVYGLDYAGTREGICRLYKDGAWQDPYISGHSSPVGVCWWSGQDTSTHPRNLYAVPERGRVAMLHTAAGNPVNPDASLFVAMLGGWSDVCMPQDDDYDDGLGVAGWERIWLPYDEPEVIGATWTRTLTGTATAALGSLGLTLTTGVGESLYYTAAPAMGGLYDSNGVLFEVHVDVGSGTFTQQVTISNGANDFTFSLAVTTTTIVLRDVNAGTNLVTVNTTAQQSGIALRIHAYATSYAGNNGAVKAWYRTDGPWAGGVVNYGPRQYRDWTVIGTGAYTGRTRGAAAAASVSWGFSAITGAATVRMVAFTDGQYVASTTPATNGRLLTGPAAPLHLTGGLRMHATSGPTVYGDTWTHTLAYDYAVEHVDPVLHPSPRVRHRSTTMAQPIDLTWTTDVGWQAGDPLAVLILGANWRTATLYRDPLGASAVCSIDLGVTGLGFVRSRDQIVPAAGANLGFFAHEGSLVGATLDINAAGVYRKIRHNRAGAWMATGAADTYPSVRATLEEYDPADAASGTLDLWMPGGLFIVTDMAATDTLMLRIDAQDTADGYIETGTVFIGRPHVLRQYARGRSRVWTPNAEMTTLATGARMARRRGPPRRSVELAWTDAIDETNVSTGSTTPDHYTLGYTSAPAVGAPAATPMTIAGILAGMDGARVPLVYLPAFKQPAAALASSTPYVELDPTAYLYGRITSESWRTDAVLGSEHASELTQGGALVIEEEV